MRKEKLFELLKQRNIDIKSLGIYLAVVLVFFSLCIPLIEKTINKKTQENTIPAIVEDKSAAKLAIEDRDVSFSEYTIDDIKFNKQSDDTYSKAVETETSEAEKSTESTGTEIKTTETKKTEAAEIKAVATEADATEIAVKETKIKEILWPLKGDIIQKMGLVYSKTFCDYRFHNGIDIEGDEGDMVVAILAGKVEKIEISKSEKTKIWLNHGNGWRSYYSHLEQAKIKVGDTVKAGQEIGIIGHPGQEEALEGPHLHYALEIDGQPVNPLDYMP